MQGQHYAIGSTGASIGAASYAHIMPAHSEIKAEPPRTIASASSKIDLLNERLAKAIESLSMASSQIGALTNMEVSGSKDATSPGGAVHRLNDQAELAHERMNHIENLIAGIARALG